jgi:hypothetical protein
MAARTSSETKHEKRIFMTENRAVAWWYGSKSCSQSIRSSSLKGDGFRYLTESFSIKIRHWVLESGMVSFFFHDSELENFFYEIACKIDLRKKHLYRFISFNPNMLYREKPSQERNPPII